MNDAREDLFQLWSRHGTSFESDSREGYELADAILASGWLARVKASAWDDGWASCDVGWYREDNPHKASA